MATAHRSPVTEEARPTDTRKRTGRSRLIGSTGHGAVRVILSTTPPKTMRPSRPSTSLLMLRATASFPPIPPPFRYRFVTFPS
jgi:hypothetical protein